MITIGNVYCHINNGGVQFSIIDDGNGPTICVDSMHFGNNKVQHTIHVSKEALVKLADMFSRAAEYDSFSDDYCHAARSEERPDDVGWEEHETESDYEDLEDEDEEGHGNN